jgi:hypothetical protein
VGFCDGCQHGVLKGGGRQTRAAPGRNQTTSMAQTKEGGKVTQKPTHHHNFDKTQVTQYRVVGARTLSGTCANQAPRGASMH